MSAESAPTAPSRSTAPSVPSSPELAEVLAAIQAGDTAGEDFAQLKLPDSYLGVTVHADEAAIFEGLPTKEKDPRTSLHLDQVPLPELGPGEALVAVMASAI